MDWIDIKGNEEIQVLLKIFGQFHDSCLKELVMSTGTYVDDDLSMGVATGLDINIRMLFQRQLNNPSAIEMLFEGVTHFHLSPSKDNCHSIIFDAILLLQNDTFYWADVNNWSPNDCDRDGDVTWISFQRVKWRDVSAWMGEKRRYGELKEE